MKHLHKIYEYKKELRNDLVSLFYAGLFSDSFTELLVQLTDHDEHAGVKKKPILLDGRGISKYCSIQKRQRTEL